MLERTSIYLLRELDFYKDSAEGGTTIVYMVWT